jgi:hypothetical protein
MGGSGADTLAGGAATTALGSLGPALGGALGMLGSRDATELEGESGTDGPRRTPATRGQATPTAKPTAAIAPTLIHDGRSAAAEGTSTVGEPLRSSMGEPYHSASNRREYAAKVTRRPRPVV